MTARSSHSASFVPSNRGVHDCCMDLARVLLLLLVAVWMSGCACPRTIEVHLFDCVKDGYASGVDRELIHLLVDGELLPADALGIEEVTDLRHKENPELSAKEYVVTFDRKALVAARPREAFLFCSDLALNLSVLKYELDGRCGWRSSTLPDEEATRLWRRHVPQGFHDYREKK